MKNKSINIKEEILNSFRENYEQKDGEWGYHGWVDETSFDEVYDFLSNSLDRMREERDREIAKLIENTVFQHVTEDMEEKKLAIIHLRNIVNILKSEEKPKA